MKNIKEIEKIYFNFEKLADDYRDLPETLAAHRKTMEFLTADISTLGNYYVGYEPPRQGHVQSEGHNLFRIGGSVDTEE